MKNKNRMKGFLLVFISTFAFATQGVLARVAMLDGISLWAITGTKIITGFLAAIVIILITRQKLTSPLKMKKDLWLYLIAGVFGVTIAAFLFNVTYSLIGASQAIVYFYTSTAFSVIGGRIFLKEKITLFKVLGIISVLSGCFLVGMGTEGSSFSFNVLGIICGVLAGASLSTYNTATKVIVDKYGQGNHNFYVLLVGVITVLPFFPPGDWGQVIFSPSLIWLVLYGALTYGVGYAFYTRGLKYIEAGEGSIMASTDPVISIVLAYLILGEHMTWVQIVGAVLIVGAVFLIGFGDRVNQKQVESEGVGS